MPRLFALLLVAALATPAAARAPTKDDVDKALLLVDDAGRAGIDDAQTALDDALAKQEETQRAYDNAQVEVKAAKAWVDAAKAVVSALTAEGAWAEALGDEAFRADTSKARVEGENNIAWREAVHDAARAHVEKQSALLQEAKAVVSQRELELELARMEAYAAQTGSADGDMEVGKLQTRVGKAKTAAAKAAKKSTRETDEHTKLYDSAKRLAP
jgi:hypothetical protein